MVYVDGLIYTLSREQLSHCFEQVFRYILKLPT